MRVAIRAQLSEEKTNMAKRKVEVFSAGCRVCEEAVQLVRSIACPSCDVSVLNMKDPKVAERAKARGIRSLPAIAVDGKLAACCSGRGPDETALRSAGIGQPM
jgi:hypothetical protein